MNIPIIAILRGLQPEEAAEIGMALVEAGITQIEVPLNSPMPFESIGNLVKALGEKAVMGAGTILHPDDCKRLHDVGGILAISPHGNPRIIKAAIDLNMKPIPGFFTPTEAFNCIEAGARHLKLFPGSVATPKMVKALRAVIPSGIEIFAVGGISAANMNVWIENGANGFGIGSGLYRPGDSAEKVYKKACTYSKYFLR